MDVVHVAAERLTAGIAIEERREHVQRQRGGDEERILLQRLEDYLADFPRDRMPLRNLHVVLGLRRLVTGGDPAVNPVGGVEQAPCV